MSLITGPNNELIEQIYVPPIIIPPYNYGSTGIIDTYGANSPEGVVTGSVGSTYRRSDGGSVTSFYVKESGTGSIGWVGK